MNTKVNDRINTLQPTLRAAHLSKGTLSQSHTNDEAKENVYTSHNNGTGDKFVKFFSILNYKSG